MKLTVSSGFSPWPSATPNLWLGFPGEHAHGEGQRSDRGRQQGAGRGPDHHRLGDHVISVLDTATRGWLGDPVLSHMVDEIMANDGAFLCFSSG